MAHAEAHRDRVVVVVSSSPRVGIPNIPGPKKCYEKINDDRATYKERVRATYKCAEGPPGSKWNLAGDLPPTTTKRARRAYKRARGELAMLEREARPKQKPVNTL